MEAKTLELTVTARADLDDIYDYIADDNPKRAATFIQELVKHLAHVAQLGHGGVSREDVEAGLRLTIHGDYCAYFRQNDTTMSVLRVIHGAKDISRIDFSTPETRQ